MKSLLKVVVGLVVFAGVYVGMYQLTAAQETAAQSQKKGASPSGFDAAIHNNSERMMKEGQQIFRFDTFGSEAFWGDALQLHKAIAGEKNGGAGGGVSPKTALSVGLKVDLDALPDSLKQQMKDGKVDLDDPATTLALLKLNSVVGITGMFDKNGNITSMGIQCAFCHSTVDDSFAPGIGKRLDGWANRDLNVGAIVSLAPNPKPFTDLLGVDVATLKKVLGSWGPGCFDAELDKDGKALRPDGKRACTVIPPALGLAGVNLHTWTGFGSVTYWNAYVAATEMHGSGTFYDARLNDKNQYPVAAKSGSWNTRGKPDLVTSKLAALHFYQLAIPAPKPPEGSFDKDAAARGKGVFDSKAKCASCHVSPLFTEPGNNLHAPSEVGVDSWQADRSPTHMYRTAPLAGLWAHQKGGFYHDGRFATLQDVIEHYDGLLKLRLTEQEKRDLSEYLKSL
ncbi:MAG: c-type cytochrome [Acidipila sp.]|nr:c-type cytochrome [Acidipila sp.]